MTWKQSLRALAASQLQQERVLITGATGDLPELVRAIVGPNILVVAIHVTTKEDPFQLSDTVRDNVIVIDAPPAIIEPEVFHEHGVPEPIFDVIIYQESLQRLPAGSAGNALHHLQQYLAENGRIVLPLSQIGPIYRSTTFLDVNQRYDSTAELNHMRLVALNGFPFVPVNLDSFTYDPEAYYEALEGLRWSIQALQEASRTARAAGNEDPRLDSAAYALRDASAVWRTKLVSYRQTTTPRRPWERWIKVSSPVARILRAATTRYGTFTRIPESDTRLSFETQLAAFSY